MGSKEPIFNRLLIKRCSTLEFPLIEQYSIKIDGKKVYILDRDKSILRSFYMVSNTPHELLFPIRAWLRGHKIIIDTQELIKKLKPLFDYFNISPESIKTREYPRRRFPRRVYKVPPKKEYVFKIIVLDTTNAMFENFLKYLPIPYTREEDVLKNVELAYYRSLGLSFKITTIRISRKKAFKLQFWDMDINTIKDTIRKMYYKGAQCYMVFLDTNNDESRELGISLIEEIITNSPMNFDLPIIVAMTTPIHRFKTFPLALATKFKYYDNLIYYTEINPQTFDMKNVSNTLLEILEKISNNQKPFKRPIVL